MRTYSGQWTCEEAAISGHRFTVQCLERRAGSAAFRRRPGSCPQKPKESLPAPRELYGRKIRKSWSLRPEVRRGWNCDSQLAGKTLARQGLLHRGGGLGEVHLARVLGLQRR